MLELMMIWRRDPGTSGLQAVADGAKYYKSKYGAFPNFLNIPPGFLEEIEIAKLRERITVATNAPKYFRNDIWLGIKTQAQNKEKQP